MAVTIMAILKPDPPQAHFLPWRGPGASISRQPCPASPTHLGAVRNPGGSAVKVLASHKGEGRSSGSPTTQLTAAGRRLWLWGDGGVGVGR